jgi:nuclease HARBI1
MVCNDTLAHIGRRYRTILEWHPALTYNRLQYYSRELEQKTGLPRVWGFINGTFRRTCRPVRHQQSLYSGYKKAHGIKFQGIITPDGLMLSCAGPFLGKDNDTYMFQQTELKERFDDLFRDKEILFLYGDSPYNVCSRVLAPYRQTRVLSAAERSWNRRLSSDRISVKQMFRRVLNLWHGNALSTNLKVLLQPVSMYYLVAVLFTNIHTCLHGNCVSARYGVMPLSLGEYLTLPRLEDGKYPRLRIPH